MKPDQTYTRKLLPGPRTEAVRVRNARPGPSWLKSMDGAELERIAEHADRIVERQTEREKRDHERREVERAKIAALPKPASRPSVKARISARRKHPELWRRSKGAADFTAQLKERFLAALEIARRTHADEDADRIMAEIAALGNEESAEPMT